ncbi:5'-methylthioadenosine phosphorylase [candidate division MSBL1 archaeon SCGC-AAA261D19]|uniref:Probable 6-oxopurine nucleoside phosphorylase n=1 Tax=candidate division MSBL1 archaeon SCGC-AAA261D19 TaxID=1698273 RepID=A0A133V7R4_9EURY|nr:5'-methylthioadenosine phosphorylase [candidate division MSBL1 archaeon SCGC-AAA261D19]
MEAEIAVIGGSSIYSLNFIKNPESAKIDTPYGKSPEVLVGKLKGRKIAFLPRHGKEHTAPPHLVNYRANLMALRELGVKRILATAAVGSLDPGVKPGKLVLLDQFIDFTKCRPTTFYEGDEVVHVDVSQPYCPELREVLINAAKDLKIEMRSNGTYACMEGPRYETGGEISMLVQLNCDVVGMTNVPECVLARELEICYSAISTVTNFAAGISDEKLTHDEVKKVMSKNIEKIKALIIKAVPQIPKRRTCPCKDALKGAKVKP